MRWRKRERRNSGANGPADDARGTADNDAAANGGAPSDGPRPKLGEIESLEPRILLSATWADADTGQAQDGPTEHADHFVGSDDADIAHGLGGDDVLHGGGGDDQLFGDAGDDTLIGGEGSNLLAGGEGHDTADYSDASGPVRVDLTSGHVQHPTGTDTLDSIERVVGSAHDDTFAFEHGVAGAVYEIDGGGGQNTIDLSHYDSSHVRFEDGQLHVDTADGGHFTIRYENIGQIHFGDVHATVLSPGVHELSGQPDQIYVDGDHAFRLSLSGAGTAHGTYDADTNTLAITGLEGTGANSTLALTSLAGQTNVAEIHVNTQLGELHTDANIGTLQLGAQASIGEVSVAGGQGTIQSLVLGFDADHAGAMDVHASVGTLSATASQASVAIHGNIGLLHLDGGPGELHISGSVTTMSGAHAAGRIEIDGDLDRVDVADLSGTLVARGVTGRLELTDGDVQHSAYFAGPGHFEYDGTAGLVVASDEVHLNWFDPSPNGQDYPNFNAMASAYQAFRGTAEGTINFNNLGNFEKLGEQYRAATGVSFLNTAGGQYNAYSGGHAEGNAYVENLTGYDNSYMPDKDRVYLKFDNNNPNTPFTIRFDQPVSQVGAFLAVGKEGTVHSLQISLYDQDGQLIQRDVVDSKLWDAVSAKQNHETFFAAKLDQAVISRVEILNLSQTNFSNALVIDNLTWSHAPATLPMQVSAGDDLVVEEGDRVWLPGRLEGARPQDVQVSWVQTGGPQVELDNPNAIRPAFTAPEQLSNTTLTFEMHVTRGGQTFTDVVQVLVSADNDAPTASAGPDQLVREHEPVQLAGGGTDPEGQNLQYTWVQTGGPPVELSDPHAVNPTFTAPNVSAPTPITFELHVSDGQHTSVDTVTIHVAGENDAPVVDAGTDQEVDAGAAVRLYGSGADPEGEAVTYQWFQTSGPTVALSDPTAPRPTFVAPQGLANTELTFELRVSDGRHESTDTVTVRVNTDPDAPSAHAGPEGSAEPGETVQLAGSAAAPAGQELTYEWVQAAGPPVELSDAHAPNPSFAAPPVDAPTELRFELRVSDGQNTSVDTVTLTVAAPAATPEPTVAASTQDAPADDALPPPRSPAAASAGDWDGTEDLQVLDPVAELSGAVETGAAARPTIADVSPDDVVGGSAADAGQSPHFVSREQDLTLDAPPPPPPIDLPSELSHQRPQDVFVLESEVVLDEGGAQDSDPANAARGRATFVPIAEDADLAAGAPRAADAPAPPPDQPTDAPPPRDGFWALLWGLIRGSGGTRASSESSETEKSRRT